LGGKNANRVFGAFEGTSAKQNSRQQQESSSPGTFKLEPRAYRAFCSESQNEFDVYFDLIQTADNLLDHEKETTLQDAMRRCNINSSWDQMKQECEK
jgi:hypothetical protein